MKEKDSHPVLVETLITIVAIAMAIYHLVFTQYLFLGGHEHQIMHLGFALVIVFLYALRTAQKPWHSVLLVALLSFSVASAIYLNISFVDLQSRTGFPTTPDIIVGILLLIAVIEAIRRSYGLSLPVIILVGLFYTFIGNFLPHPFYHGAGAPARVLSTLTTGFAGIYGSLLGTSANIIFLFILFGGILQLSGATEFFAQVASSVRGKMQGGAGETAVISSALLGTVQGSGLANVMITGAFTIPLMKRVGYKPEQAGAIEAAASAGGQIMPPVMGVAAFLMVALTGISYVKICVAAALPAILYFLSIAIYVELQARKLDIVRLPSELNWAVLLKRGPLFVIPLLVLIVQLAQARSPMYAGFWAIVSLVASSLTINFVTREESIFQQLKRLTVGVRTGAIQGAQIAAACAGLGLTMAALTRTGLGMTIGHSILEWSGSSLLLAAIMVMLMCLIFGMFSVTMVAYGLAAIIAAPTLLSLGMSLLQAHFFILFFAVFSAVTPPVAMNALGACSISGGNYFKTATISCLMCLPSFIIAYQIMWNPTLLLQPPDLFSGALTLLATLLGLLTVNLVFTSYYTAPLNPRERMLFGLCAVGLWGYTFTFSYTLLIMGLFGFILLTLWQMKTRRTAESKVLGPAGS